MPIQQRGSLCHRLPCPLPFRIYPASIMQFPGSIGRQAHQKAMLPEKGCPCIIQNDAVGLYGPLHLYSRAVMGMSQFHELPKKWQSCQGGLSALKSKMNPSAAVY